MNEGENSSVGRSEDLMSHHSTQSLVSLNNQKDHKTNVGRSTSFRTAIRSRPLRSQDFDDQPPISPGGKSNVSTPSRRSKSFKFATRFKPLVSSELADQSSSLPSTPSAPCSNMDFKETCGSTPDMSDHVFTDQQNSEAKTLGMSDSGKFSSMPVLSDLDNTRNRRSENSPRLSNGSLNFGNVKQSPKRVIDARQYFSRNKENTPSVSSLQDDEEQNLRVEGKTVSAFNDSFVKKSSENITKSPGIPAKSITLTRPLSLKNVLNSVCHSDMEMAPKASLKEDDPWIYNPSMSSKENLAERIPHSRQRTRSFGGELDNFTPDNFDWIVYANRNSLPITGISTDTLSKHHKSYTPGRYSAEFFHTYYSDLSSNKLPTSSHKNSVSSNSAATSEFTTNAMPHSCSQQTNQLESESNSLLDKTDLIDLDDPLSLGSLPMINKPLDNCVIQSRKQVRVSRSNSTPCTRPDKYQLFNRHNRTQSVDVNYPNDHEKLLEEMEDYMKRSDSTLTLTSQRFPTKFAMPSEEVREDPELETNRDSYVSTISSSSYESQESSDNQDSDGIVETLKNKIHDFRKKIYRRSGSYDNKYPSGSELDNESDAEQSKQRNTESKTSLWSLNTWFSPKKESPPDLSTVLHAGDLGGTGIGSRMADPDPIYEELGNFKRLLSTETSPLPLQINSKRVSNTSVSAKLVRQRSCDESHDAPVQNLNLQQCDSAFSIDLGDSSASEESPRTYDDVKEKPAPPSLKKADSFYEKRFSMAFDESSEVFRDSAVYCDMDSDHLPLSPISSTPTETKPPRFPIRAYIQKIEEQNRLKNPITSRVRQREPGDMIKQRLESLHNSSTQRSRSCSRPGSEDREFSRRSSTSSRSVSVDRETTPLRFSLINMDKSLEESIVCSKDNQFRNFGRENSEPGFRGRSRSRSKSPGGTLKSASSMGRLDQLNSDVENLVIMKGWVRQLIDKFQPTNQ